MSDVTHSTARPTTTRTTFEELVPRVFSTCVFVGCLALLVGLLLSYTIDENLEYFLHSYLLAFSFVASITVGALFFVLVTHLVKAGWSVVIRRLAEIMAANMTMVALLSVPIVFSVFWTHGALYIWDDPAIVAEDPIIQWKSAYLNQTFFLIRWVFYFVVFIGLSRFYLNLSRQQDETADPELTKRMEWWSGPLVALWALTTTFFSIDFIMSLDPHWFSTIFGVWFFAGSMISFFSLMAILIVWLQKIDRLGPEVTTEHRHDVGKLLFGFIVFWAYISFSQYMLYWYANIPEETQWYAIRQTNGWWIIGLLLIFGGFALPFLGLVSRHVKRNRAALAGWSCYLLVIHWFDLYYFIMPSVPGNTATPSWVDLCTMLGVGSLWLAGLAMTAGSLPLIPQGDPRLAESKAFENY
jgi:hypothetical protein